MLQAKRVLSFWNSHVDCSVFYDHFCTWVCFAIETIRTRNLVSDVTHPTLVVNRRITSSPYRFVYELWPVLTAGDPNPVIKSGNRLIRAGTQNGYLSHAIKQRDDRKSVEWWVRYLQKGLVRQMRLVVPELFLSYLLKTVWTNRWQFCGEKSLVRWICIVLKVTQGYTQKLVDALHRRHG